MTRSKTIDQFLLLLAAIALIVGLLWLITFMEDRGVPERIGFFVCANVLTLFSLTWNGIVWFGRTPRFWLFQTIWIVAHAVIATFWAYSGHAVELCVLALPVEAYVHYKIGKGRLRQFQVVSRITSDAKIGDRRN